MTTPALVSVVTIVRNDAEGFLATARSVLKQDYPALEWIVVDGLSSDGTSAYVRALSHRIADFVIEKDSGIYNAMNKGIDMATGEWMFFMNAGDVFAERNAVSTYMSEALSSDDVLYADAERREDGLMHPYMPMDMHWAGMPVDHQSLCVRAEIYRELRFDESYSIAGDLDFVSRAIIAGYKFRKIPDLVACRKTFAAGASSDYVERQDERIRVLKHYFNDKPWRDILRQEYQERLDEGKLTSKEFSSLIALLGD